MLIYICLCFFKQIYTEKKNLKDDCTALAEGILRIEDSVDNGHGTRSLTPGFFSLTYSLSVQVWARLVIHF